MEGKKNRHIIIALIYVFFGFGVLWHYLPITFELMRSITWIVLAISALTVISIEYKLFSDKFDRRKFMGWVIFGFLFTLILEIIGNKTGVIFGPYSYGDVLGIKILGAPIIIGLNWLLVVLGTRQVVDSRIKSPVLATLMASLLAVCFDVVLEPVAINLGYWNWETATGAIPWQNYLAWFGISLVLNSIWTKLDLKLNTEFAKHFMLAQLLFLTLLIPLPESNVSV
jgi:putative membrane protein